jgi:pimeloyl-ACP methyl ester carboxylesterase
MRRCKEALRTESSTPAGSLIELRRRALDGRISGNSDIWPATESHYPPQPSGTEARQSNTLGEDDMAKSSDVILVHGAWADGSSWAKVIPLLAAKGHSVTAVQLPLTSLGDP